MYYMTNLTYTKGQGLSYPAYFLNYFDIFIKFNL
jgi:hypothetical protein